MGFRNHKVKIKNDIFQKLWQKKKIESNLNKLEKAFSEPKRVKHIIDPKESKNSKESIDPKESINLKDSINSTYQIRIRAF